jgi:hypothetical protein
MEPLIPNIIQKDAFSSGSSKSHERDRNKPAGCKTRRSEALLIGALS